MQVSYDQEADAMYVRFRPKSGRITSTRIDEQRVLDRDDQGVVGVEFLFVSRGVHLEGLPDAGAIAEAIRSVPQPASAP
ncbi:MAG: DUF2283 domain-containing protein [Dehalococcoidia bacterium]|nr:DUF2283 domain-containing protein [Dehalococcoidia bacterium]HRC63429.1 DUF2283 domain-containing protein [Dehalococcoidia bacterium]